MWTEELEGQSVERIRPTTIKQLKQLDSVDLKSQPCHLHVDWRSACVSVEILYRSLFDLS